MSSLSSRTGAVSRRQMPGGTGTLSPGFGGTAGREGRGQKAVASPANQQAIPLHSSPRHRQVA